MTAKARARSARRILAYGLGLGMAMPRTAGFAAQSLLRKEEEGAPALSAGLLAQVAFDELVLAAMKTPGRFPRRAEYEEAGADTRAAHEWFVRHGYDADPRAYHRDPQRPQDVVVEPAPLLGSAWEHVWFPSNFEPDIHPAARARWESHEPNKTMRAWIRRESDDGPWVVLVHPFATGQSRLCSFIFRADDMCEALGCNVAMVVLPMHGPRGGGLIAGRAAFLTHNPVDVLLGITQSVWDVRRFVSWLGNDRTVGLYGISLGAQVSALAAGLDGTLAAVVAGVPTIDLLEIVTKHMPSRLYPRAVEHGLIGPESRSILRATSPLTFPPVLPPDRLHIFAATGDRMAPPAHAKALWRHWGRPELRWFDTNHTGFLWNTRINAHARESLRGTLCGRAAA